jgi:hypothetical protein
MDLLQLLECSTPRPVRYGSPPETARHRRYRFSTGFMYAAGGSARLAREVQAVRRVRARCSARGGAARETARGWVVHEVEVSRSRAHEMAAAMAAAAATTMAAPMAADERLRRWLRRNRLSTDFGYAGSRPVPHSSRVGCSQITGCSNLYPLNASQSVSEIWLQVFSLCLVSLS